MAIQLINGESISLLLFFIGLYGLCSQRSIIKAIISIEIMQSAIVLFFVTINFQAGSQPPIGTVTQPNIADPLPQALMLTAIVIGVAITAVSLAMVIVIQQKYGTTDWQEIIKKRRKIEQ